MMIPSPDSPALGGGQLRCDVVEYSRKVRSGKSYPRYDTESDQCGDEPIFDRGDAALGVERKTVRHDLGRVAQLIRPLFSNTIKLCLFE
jgi:hypothetical protein